MYVHRAPSYIQSQKLISPKNKYISLALIGSYKMWPVHACQEHQLSCAINSIEYHYAKTARIGRST